MLLTSCTKSVGCRFERVPEPFSVGPRNAARLLPLGMDLAEPSAGDLPVCRVAQGFRFLDECALEVEVLRVACSDTVLEVIGPSDEGVEVAEGVVVARLIDEPVYPFRERRVIRRITLLRLEPDEASGEVVEPEDEVGEGFLWMRAPSMPDDAPLEEDAVALADVALLVDVPSLGASEDDAVGTADLGALRIRDDVTPEDHTVWTANFPLGVDVAFLLAREDDSIRPADCVPLVPRLPVTLWP